MVNNIGFIIGIIIKVILIKFRIKFSRKIIIIINSMVLKVSSGIEWKNL